MVKKIEDKPVLASLYQTARVQIKMREKLCGGIPKTPDLIKGWLESRKPPLADLVEKTVAEMGAEMNETEERAWTGFKRDAVGIYIEGRQIKALLKEVGNVSGVTVAFSGSKNQIQHFCFVDHRIYLGKPDPDLPGNYVPVTEPDGYDEAVCHISGPSGKRSALKRFDYVLQAVLSFEIRLGVRIDSKELLPMGVVRRLLEYGQDNGLGSNRSQDFGSYDLVTFEVQAADKDADPWKGLRPLGKKAGKAAASTSDD